MSICLAGLAGRAGAQSAARSASAPPSAPNAPAPSGRPSSDGETIEPAATPAPAAAPAPPKKLDKATLLDAKRAYSAGELSYQAGDFKSAIINFRDAQAHIPSPHASYWLAMSLKSDGQVPEAVAEFESFLANPNAAKVGEKKVAEARTVLEALKKTPGTLSVVTDPVGANVAVDGDVRSGVAPLAVEMTPGKHTITISLIGFQSMELELEMPPGSKGEQTFKLEKNPDPPPAPAATMARSKPAEEVVAPPPLPPPPRNFVPAYVLFGLAGAGVVTGTIFGVMALSDQSKFNDNPTNDGADLAESHALAADITFGAAITMALAGTAYLVTPEAVLTRKSGSSKSRTLAFTPYGAPRGAGASARWSF